MRFRLPFSGRVAAIAILGFVIGGGGLAAQVEGRWRVVLSDGSAGEINGDLRLVDSAGHLSGTLLLETSDSAPVPLHGSVRQGEEGFEFFVAVRPEQRFAGRMVRGRMVGTMTRGHRQQQVGWIGERISGEGLYIPLPRFTLKQIVLGPIRPAITISANWFAALDASGLDAASILRTYRDLAARSGVPAADEAELRSYSFLQAMAVWKRREVLDAARRSLEFVRARLDNDTLRARFDLLFHPDTAWVLDIHQAAAHRVHRKFPHVTWQAIRPALAVPGVERQPLPIDAARDQWLTYSLYVLSLVDPVRFDARMEDIRALEPEAAGALDRMLIGYGESMSWYQDAVRFLLVTPWLEDGRALVDLVREVWPDADAAATFPRIEARPYGRPDGTPGIAPPDSLVARILEPMNWTAGAWLADRGTGDLLATLGHLPEELGNTRLLAGTDTFELTSVGQLRDRRRAGFLNEESVIFIAPGFQPIMALGTVIHEWVHILHQRAIPVEASVRDSGGMVWLASPDLIVSEGVAEWLTARVLAQVVADVPLVGLGDAEKLASMAMAGPNTPHLLGYLLFRLLQEYQSDANRILSQAIHYGYDTESWLAAVAPGVPLPVAPSGANRTFPLGTVRRLIPQVTFRIDGHSPVVEERRILPPPSSSGNP
jgi:hypothetical protein